MKTKNKYPLMYIFIAGMIILWIIAFINAGTMVDRGVSVMFFNDPLDSWMDFFNPINHAGLADPYIDTDRIYPPICYCFFWLISRFVPKELYVSSKIRRMKYLQPGAIVFTMYMVITVYLFVTILERFIRLSSDKERLEVSKSRASTEELIMKLFVFAILFSSPFMYQFERANIILIALMFLLLYILLKDSENKVLRELSLICLAIAACIKIYPAAFGLLLLKEKRWKDAVRTVIYGIAFFFLPFAVMGGFDKIPNFLEAIFLSPDNSDPHMYGFGNKLNFSNLLYAVHTFFLKDGVISPGNANENASRAALILTLFAAGMATVSKEKWKIYALLTGIMVGFPAFSFMYCSVFICIPLVALLTQKREKFKVMDAVYLIIFLMIFGVHIYKTPESFEMANVRWPFVVTDFIQSLGVFLLTSVVSADVFFTEAIPLLKKLKTFKKA